MYIASSQNPRIKHVVRLRDDRRERRRTGLTVAEGHDEIRMATTAGHVPVTIFTSPEAAALDEMPAAGEVVTVSQAAFRKMSYRENPDGWLAVFRIRYMELDKFQVGDGCLVMIVESVEKPGNLGAILRTADAAGVDLVISCGTSGDLWSPNVIRASRGTVFTTRGVEAGSVDIMRWLKAQGIRSLAATPSATTVYTSADMRGRIAIVVGSEDRGLSSFWLSGADAQISIPLHGSVNSLNVSVAAAILLYEAVRQRSQP